MSSRCPPSHTDAAWKYALENYFADFMHFFYLQIAEQIDWSAGYELLDRELQALTKDSKIGKRLVDKLVKVRLKNGQACLVLLHIEIQGHYETRFPQRFFGYYCKLYERYGLPILSLAILADDRANWRPSHYQSEVCGELVLRFQFLGRKLLDYRGQEEALLAMANPLGTVVVAHLTALATREKPEARYADKFRLTR